MASFWKKLSTKKILAGFLMGSILIVFFVWLSLPFLLKWGLSGIARDSGISDFRVEVDQVDPWLTRLSKIEMLKKDQLRLAIDQINLIYNPGTLATGTVNAISVTGLDLEFQPDEQSSDGRAEDKAPEPLEQIFEEFLAAPYLTYLRVRNSKLTVIWDGQSYPVDFLLQGDFHHQIGRLILDGSLSGFQFQSKVDLAKEEGKTYLTGEVKFPDLTKFSHLLESTDSLGQRVPEDLTLLDGEIELMASARVESDAFKDLFLELNASNLQLLAFGHDLNVSDAVLFLSPETMDDWQANFYANMEVDDQLDARGLRLSVKASGSLYEISGAVSQLRTTGDLPALEVTGLRLPILDLTVPLEIPPGQEKKLFFDEVSYDEGLLTLKDGNLSFDVSEEDKQVSLSLSPCDVSFGEIDFMGLSYEGLLNWGEFPKISHKQVVAGERITYDSEPVVENLELAFRMDSLERILIDQFTFDASGATYELNPANMLVKVTQENPEAPVFNFKGSTFRVPEQDLQIKGIEGELALSDWDEFPKVSRTQVISAKRIVVGSEAVVENLALAFRMESLEQILVDQFSFGASGVSYDLNPGNLTVKVSQENPEAPVFVFRGSTFQLLDEGITIEGIEGEIALASTEPLATKGSQTLSFDRIVLEDLELGEGNFSFRVELDGTIFVERAHATLWGGEVGLIDSTFQLDGDDCKINTRFVNVDGQKVADYLFKKEVRINGSFTGDITFSNEGGSVDYSNGLIVMDPSPSAWINYHEAGEFDLAHLPQESKEHKKMKLANEAIKSLDLKSMRILFKALGGPREMEINIKGENLNEERKIYLTDNRTIIGGMREIATLYFKPGVAEIFGFVSDAVLDKLKID